MAPAVAFLARRPGSHWTRDHGVGGGSPPVPLPCRSVHRRRPRGRGWFATRAAPVQAVRHCRPVARLLALHSGLQEGQCCPAGGYQAEAGGPTGFIRYMGWLGPCEMCDMCDMVCCAAISQLEPGLDSSLRRMCIVLHRKIIITIIIIIIIISIIIIIIIRSHSGSRLAALRFMCLPSRYAWPCRHHLPR